MFVLGKILGALLFFPGITILLMALSALLIMLGKKRAALISAILSCSLLYFFSIAPVSDLLLAPLEDRYAPLTEDVPKGSAIVVLGGGDVLNSPEYGGHAALIESGAVRAAYGARIAREFDLPIVFSSGAPLRKAGTESEADAASRFFSGIGFPSGRVRLETKSRDTAENAAFTAKMIEKGPIILITSAFHMPRAVISFRKLGIDVIPAPTDYRRNRELYRFIDFLPSANALELSTVALHEYTGILYYLLK
jgi:uncharacterized SAM-binding protein YcdF (DUF218 family)